MNSNKSTKKQVKPLTREEELLEELKILRLENKVVCLNSKRKPTNRQKAIVINELRQKHDLDIILNHISVARSSFIII